MYVLFLNLTKENKMFNMLKAISSYVEFSS